MKICAQETERYYELYDLTRSITLTVSSGDEAVYDHGLNKSPLYINHLENGLQMSLHPFIKEVCGTLGVSPSQFTPNAIAILVGFLVICHRVGVEPSLRLFGNLIGIKTMKKDAHYFFHYTAGCKFVSDAPESNRYWKEWFVWAIGADLILDCPTWPKIKKEALKPSILLADEGRQLEKMRSYSGSKEMSNLFESASLRAAGVSGVPPTEMDKAQATLWALPLDASPKKGEGSSCGMPASVLKPQKCLRGNLALGKLADMRSKATEIVAKLVVLSCKKEKSDKKRRRVDREQGPSGTAGSARVEFVEGSLLGPPPHN